MNAGTTLIAFVATPTATIELIRLPHLKASAASLAAAGSNRRACRGRGPPTLASHSSPAPLGATSAQIEADHPPPLAASVSSR